MLERDLIIDCQNFANSDAVAELLNRLEAKFTDEWKSAPLSDTSQRENAFYMVRAIEALRAEIKNVAQSQKIAEWNRRLKQRAI